MTNAAPETLLDYALLYARGGWAVIPLHYPTVDDVCSCGLEMQPERKEDRVEGVEYCASPGKHPLTKHGLKDATRDERQIRAWWKRWPEANIGLPTGPDSFVVVDVDPRHGGDASLQQLLVEHGGLEDVVSARTGSGGQHLLFAHPGWKVSNNQNGKIGTGLDVRGDGGYIVAPPSRHINGADYVWENPPNGHLPELPLWLVGLMQKKPVASAAAPETMPVGEPVGEKYALAALNGELEAVRGAVEGNRNNQLNESAYKLGQLIGARALGESDVESSLFVAACSAGLGAEEARKTIRSGIAAGKAEPRVLPERTATRSRQNRPQPAVAATDEPPDFEDAFGQTEIDPSPISPDTNPRYWRQTHEGVAKILVDRHAQDLRFVYDLARGVKDSEYFAVWDGEKWEISALAVVRLAEWMREMTAELRESVRKLLSGMAEREIEEHQVETFKGSLKSQFTDAEKKFLAFSATAESTTFKSAWQQQIKTYQHLQIKFTEFDRNPNLLNCQNGTLNLETGELLPFCRDDYITKQIDVVYDPQAECPTWMKFLKRIFQRRGESGEMIADMDLISYLQKAIGYTITGQTSEECFFICWGTGGNGKSKFLGAISDLLGPYAAAPSIETFLDAKRNSQGASEDIASLRGAHLAVATEPDDGARLAGGLLKRLSGRDEMSARFLFQNSFKFKPTHKLWLLVNEEPQLNGSDGGIKRRLRKIPFTAEIKDDEINRKLDEELRAELPGILNWALAGALLWQKEGLASPEVIQKASDRFFTDQDTVQVFIDERCYVEPTVSTSKPGTLYEAYVRFCEQNRIKGLTKNRFGRELTKKGFEIDDEGKTRRGIRLSNVD